MTLTVVPLSLRAAREFVAVHHRHHGPPVGHRWSIGVVDSKGILRGVAIVGRPVSRVLDDGLTVEVNRTCTDGFPNANSALYGAAWRAARAMGYRRMVTYTQAGESGASLRASNAVQVAQLPPRAGWADSSVALRAIRDPIGRGGVARTLWEWAP